MHRKLSAILNANPLRLTSVPLWLCPNCGQTYFGDPPPDICAFCNDLTTWKDINADNVKIYTLHHDVVLVQLPLPLVFYEDV